MENGEELICKKVDAMFAAQFQLQAQAVFPVFGANYIKTSVSLSGYVQLLLQEKPLFCVLVSWSLSADASTVL